MKTTPEQRADVRRLFGMNTVESPLGAVTMNDLLDDIAELEARLKLAVDYVDNDEYLHGDCVRVCLFCEHWTDDEEPHSSTCKRAAILRENGRLM